MNDIFERVVGNKKQVSKLVQWVESKLYGNAQPLYYILYSKYPGNGLTYITECIAEYFNLERYEVTPLDIEGKDDVSRVLSNAAIKSLSGKKRLIVIDEVTALRGRYRNKLFRLPEITTYPVIFATTDLYTLPKKYRKKDHVIKIYTPSTNQMVEILKQHIDKYDLDIESRKVFEIAKESKSIKTAINALLSKSVTQLSENESLFGQYFQFMNGEKVEVQPTFPVMLCESLNVSNSKIIKLLAVIRKLVEQGQDVELSKRIFGGGDAFSGKPTYPKYYQYKANGIQNYRKVWLLANKIAGCLHCSIRVVINEYLPILKELAQDDEWLKSQIRELSLSKSEVRKLGLEYIPKEVDETIERTKPKETMDVGAYF